MSKSFVQSPRMNRAIGSVAVATMTLSAITLASSQTAQAFSFSVAPAGTVSQPTWNGLPTTQIDFTNTPTPANNGGTNTTLSGANRDVSEDLKTLVPGGPNGAARIQEVGGSARYTQEQSTQPLAGDNRYLAVGSTTFFTFLTTPSGEVRLSFDAPRGLGYFGFFWGSPSTNDEVVFTLRNALGQTSTVAYTAATIFAGLGFDFEGTGILNPQDNPGRFVNFFATNSGPNANQVIESVLFRDTDASDLRSFEIDNIAYQQIPTPALLPGLVAIGVGLLRKRMQEETAVEVDALETEQA